MRVQEQEIQQEKRQGMTGFVSVEIQKQRQFSENKE